MGETYRIFAINPGSTSTKVALFENDTQVFSLNARLEAAKVKAYPSIHDALPYYVETILAAAANERLDLEGTHAFIGHTPGLEGYERGTYEVNDLLISNVRARRGGQNHPVVLGLQLAHYLASRHNAKAYVLYPHTNDLLPVARLTGLANVFREGRDHPLNQREVARRYAVSVGKSYDELNLVIAHIGGGLSVSAHRAGLIIDSSDCIRGDGPMTPTRTGALPLVPVIEMCFSGQYTIGQMLEFMTGSGGLTNHFGTADLREVMDRIKNGDEQAKLVVDAMIYQIGKEIWAYAGVLKGKVDAILLTGGMSHNEYVVEQITETVSVLAPVKVYPGEFEMEAMGSAAFRALSGEEPAKPYEGER